MGRIAVDAEAASHHSSKVAASHDEIPAASARTNLSGNTAVSPASEFFNDLQAAVDELNTQVGKLQNDASNAASGLGKAAAMMIKHDKSVQADLKKISATLAPGAKKPAAPGK